MSKNIKIDLFDPIIDNLQFIHSITKPGFEIDIILASDPDNSTLVNSIGTLQINRLSLLFANIELCVKGKNDINGHLNIYFDNEIKYFDIAIISLIAIFKDKFRNVDFQVVFPQKTEVEIFARFRDIFYSIRSWHESMYGYKLYRIQGEHNFDVKVIKEPDGILPLVLINPETFEKYFINKSPLWNFNELFKNISDKELAKQLSFEISKFSDSDLVKSRIQYLVLKNIIAYFDKSITWENNHRVIFQHYLKMLSELDVSRILLSKLNKKEASRVKIPVHRIGNYSEKEMSKIRIFIERLNLEIVETPPYLVLLFSVLLKRNLNRTENNVEDQLKKIRAIWEFSKSLFKGIKELARNIIDHTESKTGVISGRIYKINVLKEIKNTNFKHSKLSINDQYVSYLKEAEIIGENLENDYLLDLIIFDKGQIGVMAQLIANIDSLNSYSPNLLYKKDKELLLNNEIKFMDLFNTKEIKLNHQAIKASSHWGLLTFSKLIEKNKGLFITSSKAIGNNSSYNICAGQGEILSDKLDTLSNFSLGTYFNITLPIGRNTIINDDFLKSKIPSQSDMTLESLQSLLKFKEKYDANNIKEGSLLIIKMSKFNEEWNNIIDQRYEIYLAKKVCEELKKNNLNQLALIPVLDFDNCIKFYDQSKLFRFLAALQNEINIYSLIISNIPSDIIFDLFTLNTKFSDTSKTNSPFWNIDHFIMIYSYIEKNGYRKYHSNILGGTTFRDFILLNEQISHSHFSIRVVRNDYMLEDYSEETLKSFSTCPFFFGTNGGVQNIELILTYKGRTFFEHSIEFILNQNL